MYDHTFTHIERACFIFFLRLLESVGRPDPLIAIFGATSALCYKDKYENNGCLVWDGDCIKVNPVNVENES